MQKKEKNNKNEAFLPISLGGTFCVTSFLISVAFSSSKKNFFFVVVQFSSYLLSSVRRKTKSNEWEGTK